MWIPNPNISSDPLGSFLLPRRHPLGRNITIDARRGGGAPHEILFGEMTIEPTMLRNDGSKIVFPDITPVGIDNGLATLTNVDPSPSGPEPAWAYKATFR